MSLATGCTSVEERGILVRKLYVGGLPFETTDAELRALFEQAGKVDSAVVITDSVSGRSRGFGCVEMSTKAGARRAISEFNGMVLGGTDDNGRPSLSSPPEAGRPAERRGPLSATVAGIGGEAAASDATPACSHGAHHWSIGRPEGPISRGVCKWCDARRDFANSQSERVRKPFTSRY
jgi:hypothetical protein